jgi:hypothetical protein
MISKLFFDFSEVKFCRLMSHNQRKNVHIKIPLLRHKKLPMKRRQQPHHRQRIKSQGHPHAK